jgi:hypothetical protein
MKFAVAFLTSSMVALILIAFLPIPENVRYDSLRQDADSLRKVHRRIVIDSAPIDVAFIGTSHTLTVSTITEYKIGLLNQESV